ncbi:unnamed protein product [Ilex paraguariensis]|uniref:Uncharacterized protein n=1 Tax=Ilex paraguariensis TaxID=185542 RepID=A0ABC8TZY1_9AQUA
MSNPGSVAANVSVYKSIPRAPLVDKGKRKCNRKKVGPPPKEDWMIKEAGSDLKRKREENELLVFFDHCPKKKVSHEFFDSHSVLQSVETVNQSHRESWKDPNLEFLMETRLNTKEMERVKQSIGLSQGLIVDARGRGGGLALLW